MQAIPSTERPFSTIAPVAPFSIAALIKSWPSKVSPFKATNKKPDSIVLVSVDTSKNLILSVCALVPCVASST